MKRFSLVLMLLLAVTVSGRSQNNKEIKAASGSTYAEKQGSYTPSFRNDGSRKAVRNVILLIGDGMGVGAVNAAMYANGGELTMTNLKTMGYVKTQASDDFTTDSAASGTAYATGRKTKKGFLGVDTSATAVRNLPEKLAPLGYACGVVSTDELNGATPASFFAHQRSREATPEIWADLAESSLSFASAGSRKTFMNLSAIRGTTSPKRSKWCIRPKMRESPEANGCCISRKASATTSAETICPQPRRWRWNTFPSAETRASS